MNPFVHIAVRPAYGKNLSVVTWRMLSGFENAKIYIYRSRSNTTQSWKLLNETALQGVTYFSDQDVTVENFTYDYQYRLLALFEGQEYDSVVVRAVDNLTPHEYNAVRKIMNTEYDWMTRGRQGIQVYLFTPLLEGKPVPGYDAVTNQLFSTVAPKDPTQDGYGQRFVGGYETPLVTYVKFKSFQPLLTKDIETGEATDIIQKLTARFLAYPVINRADLIINPVNDERYVVGESVKSYSFRGTIPIAFDVELERLVRSDPRYRLPIPAHVCAC